MISHVERTAAASLGFNKGKNDFVLLHVMDVPEKHAVNVLNMVHLLGCAIGLPNEHQRPDRDTLRRLKSWSQR